MAKWLVCTGRSVYTDAEARRLGLQSPEIINVEAETFEVQNTTVGGSSAPYVYRDLVFKDKAGNPVAFFGSGFTSVQKAKE